MLVNASNSGAINRLNVRWHRGTTWTGTAWNSKKMLLSLTETIVQKLSDHPSYIHHGEKEYKWYMTLIRRLHGAFTQKEFRIGLIDWLLQA
jgi:hypothetical protein